MVQFPIPFGANGMIMHTAGADVGRDVVSRTRTAFSFGPIMSIQVERLFVVVFFPACLWHSRPFKVDLINKKEFLHAQIKS
jgi:hypothetical protein